ncbi:MAG: CAP domain-containing protein [Thermoanaerobaculia bacterium]
MKRIAVGWCVLVAVSVGPAAVAASGGQNVLRESLRREALVRINRDRAAAGLGPVVLDPVASRIADAYCEEQIEFGTTGHYSVDGQSPYMRYSLGGGNDGLTENTASWSADYPFNDAMVLDLVQRSEQVMIAEKPPGDGHRKAILDPDATHVGIGLAWRGGEFRMTQEFLRRYVRWSSDVPRIATEGERVHLAGTTLRGSRIDAISLYHEPLPRPLSVSEANRIETYSLPETRRNFGLRRENDRRGLAALARSDAPIASPSIDVGPDGEFSCTLPLDQGSGVYTIVAWVRKDGRQLPASNISIRVEPLRGLATGAATR